MKIKQQIKDELRIELGFVIKAVDATVEVATILASKIVLANVLDGNFA